MQSDRERAEMAVEEAKALATAYADWLKEPTTENTLKFLDCCGRVRDESTAALAAARREEREACRNAQCPECAAGNVPAWVGGQLQHYTERGMIKTHILCAAAAIRARGEEKQG